MKFKLKYHNGNFNKIEILCLILILIKYYIFTEIIKNIVKYY